MKKWAYYNEYDAGAAAWLRELIKAGHIAPGEVDERSIEDVQPADVMGYKQCHFFGGIGIWSYALRLARFSDDRECWTGSAPCQPFSAAGKGLGTADKRHLWPQLYRLISECKPDLWFGEQVASKDGLSWLDTVLSDLETSDYAAGAVDICAAGLGAPHLRNRLWIVAKKLADSASERRIRRGTSEKSIEPGTEQRSERFCDAGELAYPYDSGSQGREGMPECTSELSARENSVVDELAYTDGGDASSEREQCGGEHRLLSESSGTVQNGSPGPTNGFWRDADWLRCRDDRWRPVKSGSQCLAHGITGRVGLLRGYGNCITAPVAQAFIEAFLEAEQDQ